jgi:hypothetical protein
MSLRIILFKHPFWSTPSPVNEQSQNPHDVRGEAAIVAAIGCKASGQDNFCYLSNGWKHACF